MKQPFDPTVALLRIREAIRPFPPAALFALADEGFRSPFEQLVACLISVRTRDEATLVVARRLFARARTPAALVALPPAELAALLRPCAFAETKERALRALARRVLDEHGGRVPCDAVQLQGFYGVGPKCASLVLGIACGQPRVAVDVHVHRVVNRWGYVRTRTPEETMRALEAKLPQRYWVEINRLLVPFGKHLCTGRLPRCSICPVREMCQQIGVVAHR
jgi:endonuclease-3